LLSTDMSPPALRFSSSMKGMRWPTARFITRADLMTWQQHGVNIVWGVAAGQAAKQRVWCQQRGACKRVLLWSVAGRQT
jgi:hypothetical protein